MSTQTKRTRTRKVETPPNEKVELQVEDSLEVTENKYRPKKKVGANRPKNVVSSVGLGHLKVETIKGYTDA